MSAMADFWPKVPPPSDAVVDPAEEDVVSLDARAPAPGGKKTPPKAPPKAPPVAPKSYVNVAPIGLSETFDDKYKSTLPTVMHDSFAAAINASAKLTTDEAEKGFYLDGNLSLKRTDTGIKATLTMQMADWPKKSMFAFPTGHVSVEVYNPKKIDGDVNAAVAGLLTKIQATVIPEFESRAP